MRDVKVALLVILVVLFMPVVGMAEHTGNGCTNCHAPHSAAGKVKGAPLWAAGDPNFTAGDFDMFTSADGVDIDAVLEDIPTGPSALCLSCHDGQTDSWDPNGVSENHVIGTDLSKTHPISFAYAKPLADDADIIDPPAEMLSGVGAAARMECSSCHDVHEDTDGALRYQVSELCLKCHDK